MERKLMFTGFHWYELIPLVVLALLFFGPKRLPEMGSAIGKTIKEFQRSMREIREPEPEPTQAIPPASAQATPELPTASAATTAPATPAEAPKE
jgi:sec-independent protein translocase protein TatA